MTDERSESLAAQAASWVPPWERAPRTPDADYKAAHSGPAGESDDESGPAEDDDDFAPASEGGVPAELSPFPEESGGPATVDAPRELPGEVELEPTDVGLGPDLPVPGAIEEAAENEIGTSTTVDAEFPEDGDDAGDVFDAAADDDVADDDQVDLPFTEVVPGPEEDDEPAPDPAPLAELVPAQSRSSKGDRAASVRPSSRTEEEAGPAAEVVPMDDAELRAALEAILLVVDEPVAELQLAQIMEQPAERVGAMLEDISARYTGAGHGFDLRRAAGGWRLYTRPEYAAYVERFVLDGQSVRLTQAALETLAVVAYKQPVTRSRISAIRGVNCDGVMRTLNTRGLIEECGSEGETGAFLYRTTALFLEKLGLNTVDQLPPLAPFLPDDVEEVLDASG